LSAFPTRWWSLVTHRDPRFMVKGHALAVTLYGPASRFAIFEVRCLEAEGHVGIRYRVLDAERVTDAEVRQGKSSPVIADGLTWAEVDALVLRLVGEGAD
jgi:hypothetical protein